MSRSTYKWNFINEYHIAGIESWLSDQSAKGYFIKKAGRIAVFEKGTPHRQQYRLEPFGTDQSKPSPERLELYERTGWTYLTKYQRFFLLFTSTQENPPEIHTDPQIQSLSLANLQQRLRSETILLSFLILGAAAMLLACLFLNNPILSAIQNTFFTQSILVLLDLSLICQGICNCHYVNRLIGQLSSGTPMRHNAPYQQERKRSLLGSTLLLLALLLIIALPITAAHKHWNRPLSETVTPASFPLLSQLEDSNFQYDQPYSYNGTYYENSITCRWSLLAPTQYEISQSGTIPDQKWSETDGTAYPVYNPSLYIEVYHLSFSSLAPALTKELIRQNTQNLSSADQTTPTDRSKPAESVSDYDDVTAYQQGTTTLIFARKGKTVLFARYIGHKDPLSFLLHADYLL